MGHIARFNTADFGLFRITRDKDDSLIVSLSGSDAVFLRLRRSGETIVITSKQYKKTLDNGTIEVSDQ